MFAVKMIKYLTHTRLQRVKNNFSNTELQNLTDNTIYILRKTSKPVYFLLIAYLFSIGLFFFLIPRNLQPIILKFFSKLPGISSLHHLLITFIDLGIKRGE